MVFRRHKLDLDATVARVVIRNGRMLDRLQARVNVRRCRFGRLKALALPALDSEIIDTLCLARPTLRLRLAHQIDQEFQRRDAALHDPIRDFPGPNRGSAFLAPGTASIATMFLGFHHLKNLIVFKILASPVLYLKI